MKKLNRVLSAAVAACMSLTMFAGAVELDSAANAPETETLTGTAYVFSPDGQTETEFEYIVPVDATADEKNAIASEAAKYAVGFSADAALMTADAIARSNYPLVDRGYFTIPGSGSGKKILGVTLSSGGGNFEFIFDNIEDCSTINLTIEKDGVDFWQNNIRVRSETTVVFYDGGRYPNSTFYIESGSHYNAYVKGNVAGSADSLSVWHNNAGRS